jgi:hypothetical protein
MSERRSISHEDYLDELNEDLRALTFEVMHLNTLVAYLADIVKPGLAQELRERMDFIMQATVETARLEEGIDD